MTAVCRCHRVRSSAETLAAALATLTVPCWRCREPAPNANPSIAPPLCDRCRLLAAHADATLSPTVVDLRDSTTGRTLARIVNVAP